MTALFATTKLAPSFFQDRHQLARLLRNILPDIHTRHQVATMDSSSVKQSVMKQVLAEANLANARVLIEVCEHHSRNESLAFLPYTLMGID